MQVKFKERFFDELNTISDFIKLDSEARAVNFVDELMDRCFGLKELPNAHRPSQKVKRDNARDLIFKGYVIPYLISNDEILILGIYKGNNWEAQ
ncbi:type II toxin-antitoxin system RelE/ParE family toxin [Campylobacter sp. RM16192]|uniref:type II toxin-antitoxin system RelE/ParE family toxin n=1 Tax=Campylobacter sp. RM16192 TaxID=1660080 RepID=UPI0014517A98|nr:type II toxin-antitoxin system RelE/ParE family toxin [Campylobacter sp. RM16192]QCD51963.1 putative toxin-antitoxin system, toxin component, RelE/ParE family [Campylobacter sp. RM16192]